MITEKDLQAAIAECQGERNPNANTCIKLAAFYTIRNEMFGNPEQVVEAISPTYSYSGEPVETTIDYYSETEFSRMIDGRKASEVWPVIDELMSTIQAIQPRLYDGVMRKLEN